MKIRIALLMLGVAVCADVLHLSPAECSVAAAFSLAIIFVEMFWA